MMEYDIHTVLDLLTLIATVWVIYTLRIPLKDTYQEEQDSVQTYFVVRWLPRHCCLDAPDACTPSAVLRRHITRLSSASGRRPGDASFSLHSHV